MRDSNGFGRFGSEMDGSIELSAGELTGNRKRKKRPFGAVFAVLGVMGLTRYNAFNARV